VQLTATFKVKILFRQISGNMGLCRGSMCATYSSDNYIELKNQFLKRKGQPGTLSYKAREGKE